MRARASGCTAACQAHGACHAPETGGARLTIALKPTTCSSIFAHAQRGRGKCCSSTQKSAVNNKSTEERGYAANKYGDKKNKDYNAIIRTKSLDYTYKSITFGTFGAFGSGTWDVIERACDPRTHPGATGDYDPWRRPAPKRDFILSLGFALQRANVRMLHGSSLRRRENRAKDCLASGSRSQ